MCPGRRKAPMRTIKLLLPHWPKLLNNQSTIQTITSMGTFVTIEVVGDSAHPHEAQEAMRRAFDWFERVEQCCTRFDPASELMQLCGRVGTPVKVSEMLYQ